MKKFIKYAAIIGCILILVGAGIATASFSLGGNPFHAVDDIEERFENYAETKVEYGPQPVIMRRLLLRQRRQNMKL